MRLFSWLRTRKSNELRAHLRLRPRPRLQLEALESRVAPAAGFAQFLDPNPSPGDGFGQVVLPLSTGNVVVTAPQDSAGGSYAGAVYLFNGATGALISKLTGTHNFEQLGSDNCVQSLGNGNFVVLDINYGNGPAYSAGAVTFGSGVTGVNGVVSAANSLVGVSAGDWVGSSGVRVLSNGNYLVISPYWSNGAGAVTFGSGVTGVNGVVSAANSLIGISTNDNVGRVVELQNGNYLVETPSWNNNTGAVTFGSDTTGVTGVVSAANSLVGAGPNAHVGGWVTDLHNGNYVLNDPDWSDGTAANVGAVTFIKGGSGFVGVVSASNSLIGSSPNDLIGAEVTALSNGNYVVSTSNWSNGAANQAGAVTFGNGATGVNGVISAANSLVGTSAGDFVGSTVIELNDGDYLVNSPEWSNGPTAHVGAVLIGSGASGSTGVISSANSLIGSTANDEVGCDGVTVLSNGNLVVASSHWNNGTAAYAGAVTFVTAPSGLHGVVNTANSLVGDSTDEFVGGGGFSVMPLSNGNYVVQSYYWTNRAAMLAGAVTFGSGATGVSGVVSAANSLVGAMTDRGSVMQVTLLTNGNYVVSDPGWSNGTATAVGAVTFASGATGITGVANAANSLVGSTANDSVGSYGSVTALSNGNYVVSTPGWSNEGAIGVGAVTFGNGTTGVSGVISAANSLIGSSANDRVGGDPIGGSRSVTPLSNGNYVVSSPGWSNGAALDAGAVTFGNGTTGVSGVVSPANSLVGASAHDTIGSDSYILDGYGFGGVIMLNNGNYVVGSPNWSNGTGPPRSGAARPGSPGRSAPPIASSAPQSVTACGQPYGS